MKILAIDSSAKAASVAINEDGKILGEFFINVKLDHSQTLMPMVSSLLKNTFINIKDIDFFAVAAGPGSFTGVRIGVAAIKGMALANNKPCVSVSALEAMSYNFIHNDCIVCSTMDARRDQVYNAIFEINNKKIKRLTSDRAISIESLINELKSYEKKQVFLVGDGADLCYNDIDSAKSFINLSPENLKYQKASGVSFIAETKIKNGETCSAETLMPLYLRLPQAQRELNKKTRLTTL